MSSTPNPPKVMTKLSNGTWVDVSDLACVQFLPQRYSSEFSGEDYPEPILRLTFHSGVIQDITVDPENGEELRDELATKSNEFRGLFIESAKTPEGGKCGGE